jgi:plasmid stabilization system protein ParE
MSELPVQFHPEAAAEARAAKLWYEERSPAAARAFLSELDHGVARLGADPQAWPPHLQGTRRYVMRRFPFQLIYRTGVGAILVVAVAHARRRPGYWKAR